MNKYDDHVLYYCETVDTEAPVEVESDGSIAYAPDAGPEVTQTHDTWIVCETCGRLSTDEQLEDHGVSSEWEGP